MSALVDPPTMQSSRPDGDGPEEREVSPAGGESATGASADDEFDWRGWALVAAVVVSFLVIPGAIVALPAARGLVAALGLGLRDTYLVLPLVPAFLLGALAVWSAVRSRQG